MRNDDVTTPLSPSAPEQIPEWQLQVASAIQQDPRVGILLEAIINTPNEDGNGVLRALIATFGAELSEALEDDSMLEAIAERSHREMLERVDREERLEIQQQNWERSLEEIEAFGQECALTESEMGELLTLIFDTGEDILLSRIDGELLSVFYKALQYDRTMERAAEQGRIQGRNESIELQKRGNQRRAALPSLESRRATLPQREARGVAPRSNLDLGNYTPARHRFVGAE